MDKNSKKVVFEKVLFLETRPWKFSKSLSGSARRPAAELTELSSPKSSCFSLATKHRALCCSFYLERLTTSTSQRAGLIQLH